MKRVSCVNSCSMVVHRQYRDAKTPVMYDAIVVGAGVIGSWTALHLAKKGRKVLLLEQYQRSHTRGSSHGQSRIIRKLYVDQHHAQLMDEAYQLWNELQTSSGIDFFK
uniref:peroxisomal sarcosine oxidase-like n=1 Tax=Ciona intestinalis TaxID=7719 RepID=UPI000EF527CC|nr:peroxisomal sarcosine oxidase-like [Ciona intestinalis]|eukprot:XP_026694925.1 peroxisomal sarcosine oxidase-like [Ciona intestinalis]